MDSALLTLFNLLEQQTDGAITPEQAAASSKAEPWAKRLEQLAADNNEFDNIWCAALNVGGANDPVWFARGFRLGARLLLEVVGEGEVFHR